MSIALWAEFNALKERMQRAEARIAELEHQLAVRAEADRMHLASARDADARLQSLESGARQTRRGGKA